MPMTLSGPIGGRLALINGIHAVQSWEVSDSGSLAAGINSGTALAPLRRPGVEQWGGSYSGHGGLPQVIPGTLFGFEGFAGPNDGVYGNNGSKYVGDAIAASATVNWNWAQGGLLEHQVQFLGHLGLEGSTAEPTAQDTIVSNPEYARVCKIEYSEAGSVWTELDTATQASFTIMNAVKEYCNAGTDGLTGRTAGTYDFSAAVSVQESVLGAGLTKGTAYQMRMYTTATLFWLIKWFRYKEATGITYNRATGDIISQTLNFEFSGQELVSTTPTRGFVKTPEASPVTIWPLW